VEGGLGMSPAFWRDRRVLLTGHTGFKGGWLALWLVRLGAEVHGFALAPPTDPSFSVACGVDGRLASATTGDITDAAAIRAVARRVRPQVILHLAAQSLVRASYQAPVETFRTNLLGTVHVLEAARAVDGLQAVVSVTTDKCYENREWLWTYRENEALGGHDPYSSSKACAELATAAYRRSFLDAAGVRVATARAGNVIGGGDWAADRLVPDLLRAADAGVSTPIRAPRAVRPWQHVLEPLAGYLDLAEALVERGDALPSEWNFGPVEDDVRPVSWIADRVTTRVAGAAWHPDAASHPHEAHTLRLDSSRARTLLGWRPRWSLDAALDRTIDWHLAWRDGQDMASVSLAQIDAYEAARVA
jgi:CDP-glucose 4,6-dehydratase